MRAFIHSTRIIQRGELSRSTAQRKHKRKGENALDKYRKDVSKLFGEYGSAKPALKRASSQLQLTTTTKKDTKQLDHIFEEKDQMINFKYSDIGGGEYKSRKPSNRDPKTRLWGYEEKLHMMS